MDFLEDLKEMPFQVIKEVKIRKMTVTLTFKSGNELEATAMKPDQLLTLKNELIKNGIPIT